MIGRALVQRAEDTYAILSSPNSQRSSRCSGGIRQDAGNHRQVAARVGQVASRVGPTTPLAIMCASLGETRDVIEEETTCVSLLGSPHLGNDTHGGSTTKKGVGEKAGKRYGKTSFLPVLRSMPKIISQDCFRQGWGSPTTDVKS